MHQNDIFYFLKLTHQNDPKNTQKILIFNKKELTFLKTRVGPRLIILHKLELG
jgi:hypothetical protein